MQQTCAFSTKAQGAAGEAADKAKQKQKQKKQEDPLGADEEPPVSKLKEMAYVGLFGAILAAVGFCAYQLVTELFPGKLSPHGVFNRAFEALQSDADVANHFGTPLNAYGRDTGAHREGRRNFIEHEEYVDPNTGSKRCRVRFNLKGPYGHGFVFAEACETLPTHEWVYLMVQDTNTGHVILLQDNRAKLASLAAASSPEEREALANMSRGIGSGSRR